MKKSKEKEKQEMQKERKEEGEQQAINNTQHNFSLIDPSLPLSLPLRHHHRARSRFTPTKLSHKSCALGSFSHTPNPNLPPSSSHTHTHTHTHTHHLIVSLTLSLPPSINSQRRMFCHPPPPFSSSRVCVCVNARPPAAATAHFKCTYNLTYTHTAARHSSTHTPHKHMNNHTRSFFTPTPVFFTHTIDQGGGVFFLVFMFLSFFFLLLGGHNVCVCAPKNSPHKTAQASHQEDVQVTPLREGRRTSVLR